MASLKFTRCLPRIPVTTIFDGAKKKPRGLSRRIRSRFVRSSFQAAKQLKKGVDDSLKTAPKRPPNDDLDLRKRRTGEFAFGETLTLASKALETDPIAMRVSLSQHCTCSPLYSVLERFANIEKTIGIMLATNESEIFTFASSDTPIARLLAEDIPAVGNAKKDLDALMRRQESSQGTLEKEYKKLERLKSAAEEDTDMEALKSQQVRAGKLPPSIEGRRG